MDVEEWGILGLGKREEEHDVLMLWLLHIAHEKRKALLAIANCS